MKIAIYVFGLFCAFALGAFSVRATQVAGRCKQANKFYENSEAFRNAFERGAYAEAIPFACACEAAGSDFPNNEMFLRDAHFMKARAYEMTGDYDVASKSYAAYKFFGADTGRGCAVTSEPRLAYKKGKRSEAFREYCELFALEGEEASSGKPALNRLRFPKTATSTILLSGYGEKDRVLSPFAEYADFLTFMEAEFKAQGEPAEYADAMELFRSIATKEANVDGGESEPAAAGETNADDSR